MSRGVTLADPDRIDVRGSVEVGTDCYFDVNVVLEGDNLVGSNVRIGPNCLIFQQVTLGTVATRSGLPRLGAHVDVGAGARILGPVTIGDHAVIGANAVVLSDVPPGATAAGIPAKIIHKKDKGR